MYPSKKESEFCAVLRHQSLITLTRQKTEEKTRDVMFFKSLILRFTIVTKKLVGQFEVVI